MGDGRWEMGDGEVNSLFTIHYSKFTILPADAAG